MTKFKPLEPEEKIELQKLMVAALQEEKELQEKQEPPIINE